MIRSDITSNHRSAIYEYIYIYVCVCVCVRLRAKITIYLFAMRPACANIYPIVLTRDLFKKTNIVQVVQYANRRPSSNCRPRSSLSVVLQLTNRFTASAPIMNAMHCISLVSSSSNSSSRSCINIHRRQFRFIPCILSAIARHVMLSSTTSVSD